MGGHELFHSQILTMFPCLPDLIDYIIEEDELGVLLLHCDLIVLSMRAIEYSDYSYPLHRGTDQERIAIPAKFVLISSTSPLKLTRSWNSFDCTTRTKRIASAKRSCLKTAREMW